MNKILANVLGTVAVVACTGIIAGASYAAGVVTGLAIVEEAPNRTSRPKAYRVWKDEDPS